MKILVIGGTRFIGPPVVRMLAEAGHETVVFHRGGSRRNLPEEVGEIFGDRKELPNFRETFRRLAPGVVVDMIPMSESDARSVVETFSGIAGRIVAISSEDVYRAYDIVRGLHPGPPDPTPLTEDSPLRERLFPYDRPGVEEYEKILVEKTVMAAPNLPATVLRLPAVYGPGDYQNRLFPYIKRMDDGRPAILIGEDIARWKWTMGFVEDVAHAIFLAATDDGIAPDRTYNVGEENPPTHREWIEEIARAIGWSGEIVALPKEKLPPHLDPGLANTDQNWVVDTSRIRAELGYEEKTTRKEALRKTIEWERENPPENLDPKDFDYPAEDAALEKLRADSG
ncbi:MAG: NAD-dependent epimerase/dehydratase family protein [Rubrobacteraceae bacterium]